MGKLEHFKFQNDTLEGKNVGEARTAGSRVLTAKSGPGAQQMHRGGVHWRVQVRC